MVNFTVFSPILAVSLKGMIGRIVRGLLSLFGGCSGKGSFLKLAQGLHAAVVRLEFVFLLRRCLVYEVHHYVSWLILRFCFSFQ